MPIRSSFRLKSLALALVLALLAPTALPAAAQEPAPPAPSASASVPQRVTPTMQDYSKPRSHFPFIVSPYVGREVPEPVFANTPRIDQLVREGTLYLSMNDAIALALENNLDLAIARFQDNRQLKQSLEGRKVIERAKGTLMARLGLSEDEAFRRLRRAAMDSRRPMVDVANALLVSETVAKP